MHLLILYFRKEKFHIRNYSIDFTASVVVSNHIIGKAGEHNASQLIIVPPTELSSDNRTNHYRVAFFTGGKTFLSASKTGPNFIIPLSSEITRNPRLSLQIIAYDNAGNYIGKSPRIDGLKFEPSISDTGVELNGSNDDLAHEIVNISASLTQVETSVASLESGKVDKVSGKGLSSNDFTNAEKQKLAGLSNYNDGAVLQRLTEAESDIDTIESGKVDKVSGKGLSSNDFTDAEKQKLAGIDSAALQSSSITDAGDYFTNKTVEGALQELGAELSGINSIVGPGVIE